MPDVETPDNKGWWGLLIILGLVFGYAYFRNTPSSTPEPAVLSIDKSATMQLERKALIGRMVNERGLFTKVERHGKNMPRAWATSRFMSLDFETKNKMLGVLYAFHFYGDNSSDSVAIIDAGNGHEIGRFDLAGLHLK